MQPAALAACVVAAVALAASAPVYAAYLDASAVVAPSLAAPPEAAGWKRVDAPLTSWRPRYEQPTASLFEVYEKEGKRVAVYLGYYRGQRPGAQLVTSTNVMVVQKHPVWQNLGESRTAELRQTTLRSADQRLLVWDWMWISGERLTSPYLAKLYIARDRLLARGDDGAAVILATPSDETPAAAQAVLREFLGDMLPSIDAALVTARKSG